MKLPRDRHYLSSAQWLERFAPPREERQAAAEAIAHFAGEHNLLVVENRPQGVVLEGSASDMAAAFRVELEFHDSEGEVVRSPAEDASIPEELVDIVDHVLGLNSQPRSDRHRAFRPVSQKTVGSRARTGSSKEIRSVRRARHTEPKDLSGPYNFPPGVLSDCSGQKIGIISLGGGFYASDIQEYFHQHGVPAPKLQIVRLGSGPSRVQHEPVEGRWGDPAPLDDLKAVLADPKYLAELPVPVQKQAKWTVEITMDVQLVGRFCPGAEIVVYFAGNDGQGEYRAFTEALFGASRPSVLSCSWGAYEPDLGREDRIRELEILDSVFLDAALLGTTICVSSGDLGDGSAGNGEPRVQFPASDPYVLSCGGTMFQEGSAKGKEVVWNEEVLKTRMASGGGVSRIFPRPDWQNAEHIGEATGDSRHRGVPDVAGKADVGRGFCMRVAGKDIANGGTSAVAPLWASLLALANKKLGVPVGYVNALLYSPSFKSAVNDIESGANGRYRASAGWDPCTGVGSPNWAHLVSALGAKQEQAR